MQTVSSNFASVLRVTHCIRGRWTAMAFTRNIMTTVKHIGSVFVLRIRQMIGHTLLMPERDGPANHIFYLMYRFRFVDDVECFTFDVAYIIMY